MTRSISFIDLAAQQRRMGAAPEEALKRVLRHGTYIMGPEVGALERNLSAFCGAAHTVTCANGTDAIVMALMAMGVRSGDAVICPSFTFAATAEAVVCVGATPIFLDVSAHTFNMVPEQITQAASLARSIGLRPRGVIAVDLFGLAADYDRIHAIAEAEQLWVLADAAQSFGGRYGERHVGTLAKVTTTSFFPAKPLGCYGDGGAIFTDDPDLAAVLRSIRVHGQGSDKYDNVRIGMNGRLDTMQAAILLEKLAIFPEELEARQRVASRYEAGLGNVLQTPQIPDSYRSAWAQYSVLCQSATVRDHLIGFLKERSVPTAIYYPKPLHRQTAYRDYPVVGNGLPVSDDLAMRVLALPMHPYLDEGDQDYIIEAVKAGLSSV